MTEDAENRGPHDAGRPDLALVPTEALFEEIARRSDHAVLAYRRKTNETVPSNDTCRRWCGDWHVLLGLATDLMLAIASQKYRLEGVTDGEGD